MPCAGVVFGDQYFTRMQRELLTAACHERQGAGQRHDVLWLRVVMPAIRGMRRRLLEVNGGHVIAHALVDGAFQYVRIVVGAGAELECLDGVSGGGGGLCAAQGGEGDCDGGCGTYAQAVDCVARRAFLLMHGTSFPRAELALTGNHGQCRSRSGQLTNVSLLHDSRARNDKAAQCAAFKMVGPVGLEPTTKGL